MLAVELPWIKSESLLIDDGITLDFMITLDLMMSSCHLRTKKRHVFLGLRVGFPQYRSRDWPPETAPVDDACGMQSLKHHSDNS